MNCVYGLRILVSIVSLFLPAWHWMDGHMDVWACYVRSGVGLINVCFFPDDDIQMYVCILKHVGVGSRICDVANRTANTTYLICFFLPGTLGLQSSSLPT